MEGSGTETPNVCSTAPPVARDARRLLNKAMQSQNMTLPGSGALLLLWCNSFVQRKCDHNDK